MSDLRPISDRDKLEEIEREIEFRHRVYAKQIKAGKMNPALAQNKIRIMTAIRDDYRNKIAKQPDLFK